MASVELSDYFGYGYLAEYYNPETGKIEYPYTAPAIKQGISIFPILLIGIIAYLLWSE